ncbi:hypothetical protein OK349_02995 [Sphingomonas sp. BT-65]|uniref:hypothetical protein n=1 Tax=Sphingomonas sp. BT-65 TaxID=2989821 RepID=UPI002235E1C4|nr:hypothetical protein [Sphingomonas sp. BT-65]MCW4460659.1 hypothetical protein [Sphingomonas sp. BT-65]
MRTLYAVAALCLLAGCGGEPTNVVFEPSTTVPEQVATPPASPVAGTPPAEAKPLVNLAPGALSFVDPNSGRARELAFGTERAMVERAVGAALGAPAERGSNGECGEGAMDFARMPGGLLVWFQEGKFVGWFLDQRDGATLTTASGIGIGSTRKALTGAYAAEISESSLGEEFTAGELSGLLSGTGAAAKVTAIWSGQVCNFR